MNEILATNKPISGHCLGERSLDLVHDNPGECPFYWSRDMITERRCSKCGETKHVSEFYKDKGQNGLRSRCKECNREDAKKWREANLEKHRENYRKWRDANLEKCQAQAKQWRAANKEKIREYNRGWLKTNREKRREYDRVRRKANLEKRCEYERKRCSTPKGQLNRNISRAIHHVLKDQKAGRSWESLVGYTVHDLMKHLEKQFQLGMSWENYGEWHLDHRVPISVFNYKTPEDIDFKRCWALKNLQPMWAKENLSKHAKLDKPFQPSLAFGGMGKNEVDAGSTRGLSC